MKRKYYIGITITLIIVVILAIVLLINRGAKLNTTGTNSMIFFFDNDNKKLIMYENDVRKELDIEFESSMYYLKVGSGKDAFVVDTYNEVFMYYDGKLKLIEVDRIMGSPTYWISPTAKAIVYVKSDTVYLYDVTTDENMYIGNLNGIDTYGLVNRVVFSPDGKTVVFELYIDNMEYPTLWVYNNNNIEMVKECGCAIAVTNNAEDIIYADYNSNNYTKKKVLNKVLRKDGTEIELAIGEMKYPCYMNNNGSEFIYFVEYELTESKEHEYIFSTYLYKNGENIKLEDYRLQYIGKTSDRDFTGKKSSISFDLYENYIGPEETLLESYFWVTNYKGERKDFLAYIDKDGNIQKLNDNIIYYGFSVNDEGKYIYYSYLDKGYCMVAGDESVIANSVNDIDNYNGEGTYILADYIYESEKGTLYYCNDGKNTQCIMDNVASINVEGNYIYIMIKNSEFYYDVYRGNPDEGYSLIETNVNYKKVEGII